MRIGIITVNNSYNYGSYLQAKALLTAAGRYGDSLLVDTHTRSMPRLILRHMRTVARRNNTVKTKAASVLFELKEGLGLQKAWNSLGAKDFKQLGLDIALLGSDEIWNVTRKECRHPIFWGEGLNCPVASYAVSVGNARVEDFDAKHGEYIRRMRMVSVRDEASRVIVRSLDKDREIHESLDPTFLVDEDEAPLQAPDRYIAVYLFEGKLRDEQKGMIIRYARAHGLKLYAVGLYLSWCDKCVHSINGNPFAWYRNAEMVVTNTYHGTAFAIHHNRQFVAFAQSKNKVKGLLGQFGLADRNVETESEFNAALARTIDYDRVNDVLNDKIKESLDYLARVADSKYNPNENGH